MNNIKRFFMLFLTAFGIFALIFLMVSIIIVSRSARKKDRQEIEKGYAGEKITPIISPSTLQE
ncbi:hypothetical protein A2774_05265 [Candidatus Roizmanbacteria bacterium RIFCSPHIGHO2_01_FULL_39_12c]|uniref:Uncharacterized protein n=1 Tax=Candidatus Roizmanbacteria bacterium RIFCSPHIGHO2_01_FULL_39_12c TaxID=1802031 RepID=A0A1F7GBL9_9BACT|nr:MAG: hypothetical protein A2774_05265 [Candidatus Roizmanbacteria bacterium RIFCSPHIGHO2_01_FULL_39_12c]OGK47898.1 MAG: hypothetical protein A2963_03545 [Candidatus Roizmanbacteria bacterium RIFCSPLOWO2_01_FULL_40_13]